MSSTSSQPSIGSHGVVMKSSGVSPSSSSVSSDSLGALDVSALASLVAAAEEEDERRAATGEVDAVAGSDVDPEFEYSAADGPGVAEISAFEADDSLINPPLSTVIAETFVPTLEHPRSLDLEGHRTCCGWWRMPSKASANA